MVIKTQYKYLRFQKRTMDLKKKSIWDCFDSADNKLGEVRWYPRWRCYCYFPLTAAIYSAGCLLDIRDFIESLTR